MVGGISAGVSLSSVSFEGKITVLRSRLEGSQGGHEKALQETWGEMVHSGEEGRKVNQIAPDSSKGGDRKCPMGLTFRMSRECW